MITIEDQFRRAVVGDGLRFCVARANVVTTSGGKRRSFKAVVDLDTKLVHVRNRGAVVKILGVYNDKSSHFNVRDISVDRLDFIDDNYAVDIWVGHAYDDAVSVWCELAIRGNEL